MHRVRQEQQTLKQTLAAAPIAVRIADRADQRVLFVNDAYCRLVGRDKAEAIGLNVRAFYVNPQVFETIKARIERNEMVTNELVELQRPNRENEPHAWALASFMPIEYMGAPSVLAWFFDITDRKLAEDELGRQARTDFLTGAFNRRHFLELTQHELSRATRHGTPFSLLALDLDHFKRINDEYGHEGGDIVLRTFTERLSKALRDIDSVGRLGGEEFAALLPLTDATAALEVAERLRSLIAGESVHLPGGQAVQMSTSIGLVTFVTSRENSRATVEALLNEADKALYAAKKAGRNRVCAISPHTG